VAKETIVVGLRSGDTVTLTGIESVDDPTHDHEPARLYDADGTEVGTFYDAAFVVKQEHFYK